MDNPFATSAIIHFMFHYIKTRKHAHALTHKHTHIFNNNKSVNHLVEKKNNLPCLNRVTNEQMTLLQLVVYSTVCRMLYTSNFFGILFDRQ